MLKIKEKLTILETEGFQEALKRLYLRYLSRLKKFTISRCYQSGISNTFKVSHSNGITERLNNKFKLNKRITFGYRNFYHFRTRINLQHGLIFKNLEICGIQNTPCIELSFIQI